MARDEYYSYLPNIFKMVQENFGAQAIAKELLRIKIKMIKEKDCMNIVLKEFSEFKPYWEEYLLDWEDEERPGLCLDMTIFSRFFRNEFLSMSKEYKKKLFNFIELCVTQGDESVQTAATTCFLENLQNSMDEEEIIKASFVKLLGPESRDFCIAWDEFTGCKTPGLYE